MVQWLDCVRARHSLRTTVHAPRAADRSATKLRQLPPSKTPRPYCLCSPATVLAGRARRQQTCGTPRVILHPYLRQGEGKQTAGESKHTGKAESKGAIVVAAGRSRCAGAAVGSCSSCPASRSFVPVPVAAALPFGCECAGGQLQPRPGRRSPRALRPRHRACA